MQIGTHCTAYLKAVVKGALPTAEAPKEIQRTSAVGHWTATQGAARVATEPPMQNPTHTMRLGVTPPDRRKGRDQVTAERLR